MTTDTALEETYRRLFPIVRERIRRVLGDGEAATDVAQEAFIRLWQTRRPDRDPRAQAAWIHRTSLRLAIDHLRAVRVRTGASRTEPFVRPASVEDALDSRQVLELLARRVAPEILESGVLIRVDGLTQPEVAALLGVSERTVRRWLVELDQLLSSLAPEHR